jgi:hypothetical protein
MNRVALEAFIAADDKGIIHGGVGDGNGEANDDELDFVIPIH